MAGWWIERKDTRRQEDTSSINPHCNWVYNNLQESLVFLFMSDFQRKMSRSAENSDSESTWKPWLKWNSYTTAAAVTSTLRQAQSLSLQCRFYNVTHSPVGPHKHLSLSSSLVLYHQPQSKRACFSILVHRLEWGGTQIPYHISSSWILRLLWLFKAICLLWFPQGGVRHAAHVL